MTTTSSTPLTSLWRDRPPVETDAELTERYDDDVVARLDPVSQPHPRLPT